MSNQILTVKSIKMGYAVLHLDKASGNDAAMSAHIERTIEPKNADKSRTHLNRELLTFPDGVSNRTEAIQHRIENAGIKRKISHNQVRAIRIMLSGSPEEMKQEVEAGQLDDWCQDNVDWLRKTFGTENFVSAVLHLDEKTPHIHATVVPIVTGERRKANVEKDNDKRKYKKKPANSARLCADDVMARDKLKAYQDSYAEAMNKYGLQRGIEGSEARHVSTQQFYRNLHLQNETLKEDIEDLTEQKQEVYEKVRDMYDQKDEAQEKFLAMDEHIRQKNKELATIETKLAKAKQEYEPYKAQEELNLIHELFPMMKANLRIAELCRKIGLGIEYIKMLFTGKTLTAKSFSFFSPEHNQKFTAENINLKIEKKQDNPNKLRLTLNGMNILDWFREKYQEVQQKYNIGKRPEVNKSKGVKM
ncbi:mobilization protein BmpH [Bacteroidia bacterium]|nr:mobilization protein BmpH [Bacteroidia bacterium]